MLPLLLTVSWRACGALRALVTLIPSQKLSTSSGRPAVDQVHSSPFARIAAFCASLKRTGLSSPPGVSTGLQADTSSRSAGAAPAGRLAARAGGLKWLQTGAC